MKLSVVILGYNERATIRAIVDAVRASSYPDNEIILVDDGLTDAARELLWDEIAPPPFLDFVPLGRL